jgi:trigger factor
LAVNPKIGISITDDNHRSVEFTVSAKEMEKLFEKNVSDFRKQVSMKGFRPGQVPKQVFMSRFGDEVYRDTVQKVIENDLRLEFEKIVDKWEADEKLEIAAPAEHGNVSSNRGQDLVYKLNIALNKFLTTQGYKDLGVNISAAVVAEEEINDTIQGLRKRFAKDVLVSRPSKLGDVVKGNYIKQIIGGEEKPLPQNPYFEIEVSDDAKLKELKDAMTGLSAGEEKEFTINYPEDYLGSELKGKTVDYTISVTGIYELELPAQDEEFYSMIGAESEEGFKTKITDDILKDKQHKARQIALKEAFDKLIEKNPFPILEEQIKYTAERSMQRYHQLHNEEKEEISISEEELNTMRPEIIRAVQEDRLLRSIIEQESLKPTQGQVDARIDEIAKNARMDFASAKDTMRRNGQINTLRENLKIELAQNLLIGESLPERAQEEA